MTMERRYVTPPSGRSTSEKMAGDTRLGLVPCQPRSTRTDFVRQRDGEAAVEPYRALMREAYRKAVRRGGFGKRPLRKGHPYRRAWIEGYLEFKR